MVLEIGRDGLAVVLDRSHGRLLPSFVGQQEIDLLCTQENAPRLWLRGHIKWCYIDGVIFILDTQVGQYFGLSPEPARSWSTLFASDTGGRGMEARGTSSVDPDLVLLLHKRRWVTDAPEVEYLRADIRPRGLRFSPGLDAFYCLVKVAWILRFFGFPAAYDFAKSYAPLDGDRTAPATERIGFKAAMKAFHKAEHFVISNRGADDCLLRSLALFIYLRRCGLVARHIIGVRRYPFAAHAWVEYTSSSLLERVRVGTAPVIASSANRDERSGFVSIAELG